MNRIHCAALAATILGLSASTVSAQKKNLAETAIAAGAFNTLVAAAKAADLVPALTGDTEFTVFAPTDDAFAALPEGTVSHLLEPENKAQLAAILTYHVVPGRLTAADVLGRFQLDTVNGQRLTVSKEGPRIDEAKIVKTDVLASNGVIHVIDQVMLPRADNLVDTAKKTGSFRTLYAAARTAGLVDVFRGDGPLTVFAPTDEAFAKLGHDTIRDLLKPENRDTLTRILKYHVVSGRVFADQAVVAGRADTLAEAPLSFGLVGGRLRAGNANVVSTDVQASNGVIHVIDSVLTPPAPVQPKGRKYFGFYQEAPSAALAAQLGIDAHKSIVLTRVVEGSEAAKAGLQQYDVVIALGDRVANQDGIDAAKAAANFGETVDFTIIRRGKRKHVGVRVGVDQH